METKKKHQKKHEKKCSEQHPEKKRYQPVSNIPGHPETL